MSWTVGEETEVRMRSPGKMRTGLLERRGRREVPEVQRAAQALRSRLQIAAVGEGLVSVGIDIAYDFCVWFNG